MFPHKPKGLSVQLQVALCAEIQTFWGEKVMQDITRSQTKPYVQQISNKIHEAKQEANEACSHSQEGEDLDKGANNRVCADQGLQGVCPSVASGLEAA